MSAHLGEELVGEDRDVGLLEAGGGEDVDDLVGRRRPWRRSAGWRGRAPRRSAAAPASVFSERGAHRLEEADVVADARCASSCGTASANALPRARSRPRRSGACRPRGRGRAPVPSAMSVQLLRRACPVQPRRPVEAVEACRSTTSYFSSMTATACAWSMAGSPVPPLVGVVGERLLELVGDAEVVDDQAARLVAEDAVHAGDGLHQPVPAHRLVDVHRVQARARRSR